MPLKSRLPRAKRLVFEINTDLGMVACSVAAPETAAHGATIADFRALNTTLSAPKVAHHPRGPLGGASTLNGILARTSKRTSITHGVDINTVSDMSR